MTIEPYGWLVTLPMVIGLFWLYFQPISHPLKVLWRSSLEREALGWCRLGVEAGRGALGEARNAVTLFWSVTAALCAVTALSFAAYLGIL